MRDSGIVALVLALVAAGCASTPPASDKQIALTFDDVPFADGPILSGSERAQRIIAGLAEADVRQVAFFANPGRNAPDRDARYRAYAHAGHVLGNHTFTHPDLRDLSPEAFLAEVAQADAALRRLPNFRPWFRFPFLSEGDTVEKRDAVRRGLTAMGYAQAYVTVDAADWRIDQLMRAAHDQGRRLDLGAIRSLYVGSIRAAASYSDRMARATLGSAPRQVFLFHENDLAALFISDAARALRTDGWTIITADDAFRDPIASELPDTLALSEGRVAALMHAHHLETRFTDPRPPLAALEADFAAHGLH